MSDLRSKWRRSFFGFTWSMIQPLGMTLLLSIVIGKMFKQDVFEYAPYVLSGIIVWEFLTSALTGGGLAFVQAESYIKQKSHPLAIYSLRVILTNLIVLFLASVTLVLWVLVEMPRNLGWCWFAALFLYPLAALIAWPLATCLAYIGARFRDLPHMMTLIMQALWFVSPIYFEPRMFRDAGLAPLVDYNPVYHLLEIVRAPLLRGEWPSVTNFLVCILTASICAVIAALIGSKSESKVILYL